MEIKNSLALIVGGASGMGRATAHLLNQSGAKIAILDRDPSALEKLKLEIPCYTMTADISQAEALETAFLKMKTEWGIPRISINCAGIATARRIVNKEGAMPLAEFQNIINVNLIGTFNVLRLIAAEMQSLSPLPETEERGVIINTASIAAFEGQIGQTAYSASKGGVVSLTLPAARELAGFGIRVLCIAPGLVDTPLMQAIPEKAKAALIQNIPFPHRLGYPEEYAALARHIIENPLLNGTVIRLDAALRMPA